jgi:hypothetical protein
MSTLDFNNAAAQSSTELIPDGTIAPVIMGLRAGNAGDDGWLAISKSSGALMLDCEFVIESGPFAKRKFWGYMSLSEKAAPITGSTVRAILESAFGVRPDDLSEKAQAARKISDWSALNGIRFVAKIGVEKGTGDYSDKNKLRQVITPDHKEYQAAFGGGSPVASAPNPATLGAAPAWSGQKAAPQARGNAPAWANR